MIPGRTVALRPVEDEDAPVVQRWMNHPEVFRAMDYEAPVSLADVREDLDRSRREGQSFVIEADGRPVGRIGLNQFRRRDRIASLYCFIGEPACWGRGYARDAVATLLAYAFDRTDLSRVELWTLADNDRAIRVYERCGFVQEARLAERSYKDGTWVDRIVMSVTRAGFARATEAAEPADLPGAAGPAAST
jgi:RimJ/RimL family protein N-acetyltransferase